MPRYVIERTFSDGLRISVDDEGLGCLEVVDRNERHGATWLHSYVSEDRTRSFCVYDAPTPEAVRAAALANSLPVDRITEVRVLDPYFYR